MAEISGNEATVRRIIEELFNEGRHECVDECYAPDVAIVDSAIDGEVRGSGVVRQMLDAYRAAFPDVHYDIRRLLSDGDTVTLHFRTTGTHQGELWDHKGSGRRFEVDGIAILDFADGRVVRVEQIWDCHTFCHQLGVEMPPVARTKSQAHQVLDDWFDSVWNRNLPFDEVDQEIDRLWAEGAPAYGVTGVPVDGRAAAKAAVRLFHDNLVDVDFDLTDHQDAGDYCTARAHWKGHHETLGKDVSFIGMVRVRVVDGQIVEGYNYFDFLEMLTQMGAVPADVLPRALGGAKFDAVEAPA